MKLIVALIAVGAAVATVIGLFKVIGFWGALLLLFLLFYGWRSR